MRNKSAAARFAARAEDQLEMLQERLRHLRELVPYGTKKRGYALPTALILGGIATVGAVAILSLALSAANNVQTPEKPPGA